jgi:hypothetical protein
MTSAMKQVRAGLVLTLLALPTLSGAGCWLRGPDDLDQVLNVEIVISGLVDGDRVAISIDGDETRHLFSRDAGRTLDVVTSLETGTHVLGVVIERGEARLCVERAFDVDDDGASVGIDAADLDACPDVDGDAGTPEHDAGLPDGGGPNDAGDGDGDGDGDDDGGEGDEDGGDGDNEDAGEPGRQFERLREEVSGGCDDGGPCGMTTIIDGEGEVTVDDEESGDAEVGESSSLDLAALVEAVMSPAADLLFEGDDPTCPVDDPLPELPTVKLTRTVLVHDGAGEPEPSEEEIDVTGCVGGIAAEIRARVALIRDLAVDFE